MPPTWKRPSVAYSWLPLFTLPSWLHFISGRCHSDSAISLAGFLLTTNVPKSLAAAYWPMVCYSPLWPSCIKGNPIWRSMNSSQPAILLIVSGPTGSGKTTLCERMVAEVNNVQRVVTSTTREKRPGETDGIDYYFFSPETFEDKIKAGEFYEYAQVFNRDYYGTLKSEIDAKLSQNIDLLLNIDVQGAATIREAAQNNPVLKNNLVTIFVRPKNLSEIRQRLNRRGDPEQEITRRLESVEGELAQSHLYDHIIESKTKEIDFQALFAIYEAEKNKRTQ